jgi:Opacity protein and related surface antigens
MKKSSSLLAATLSTAAILGISSAAHANPEFYVGARAGYQKSSVDSSSTSTSPEGDYTLTTDKGGYAVDGFVGGLFAGVKFKASEKAFIGLEANIGTGNAKSEDTISDSTPLLARFEIEAGTSYGVAALAGLSLTPSTSIYGRLGYQRTKYEGNYKESGGGETYIGSDTFGGIRIGLGMETVVTPRMALRLDWSQTHYSSETFHFSPPEGNFAIKIEPTETLFQVGFSYSF